VTYAFVAHKTSGNNLEDFEAQGSSEPSTARRSTSIIAESTMNSLTA
jgi:hypothetical protein